MNIELMERIVRHLQVTREDDTLLEDTRVELARMKKAIKAVVCIRPEVYANGTVHEAHIQTVKGVTFKSGDVLYAFDKDSVEVHNALSCNQHLRLQDKPYPRTCAVCGLGPCTNGVKVYPKVRTDKP